MNILIGAFILLLVLKLAGVLKISWVVLLPLLVPIFIYLAATAALFGSLQYIADQHPEMQTRFEQSLNANGEPKGVYEIEAESRKSKPGE